MDSLQNSTPPRSGVRSEASCEASRRVVVVPVVVEPVPVHHHLATVLDEVRDVEVAVAVLHDCTKCRPLHCPLNTRRAVSYSASVNAIALCTKYLQLFVSFAYATPSQTVVGDALGVWTLGSVAGNRNRPRIHLLPLRIVSKQNPALPYFRQRGAKGKVQRVKQDPRHQAPSSTCEASRRVVVVPAAVEPVPVHHHLATALDEVRDEEVAAAVLHD